MTLNQIGSISFRRIVWLVPVAFVFHEAEEWNVMPWYVAQFSPVTIASDLALRTWLVAITIIAFLWTAIACLLPTVRATAYMVLPFFVLALLFNALQHIYWQFAFPGYAPAFLSCALLNVPAILLVSWHALRNRLVGGRFLGVLYVGLVPGLIETVRAGHTEMLVFREIFRFGEWLAQLLFGTV